MNFAIIIVLFISAAFLGGVIFGFAMGLTKGFELGVRSRSGRPPSPVPWILCFTGAGVALLVSLGCAGYSAYFLSRSDQTEATVTMVNMKMDDQGNEFFQPAYTYADAAGNQHEGSSSMADGDAYEVGDTIQVRYLRNAPTRSRIDSFAHHWFIPLFMAGASVILTAFGIGLRWWRARELRWAKKRLKNSGILPSGTSTEN